MKAKKAEITGSSPAKPLAKAHIRRDKPRRAAARPIPFDGNLETITREFISGWVWTPAAPEAHVRVEAVLDGEVIATGVADIMREDLAVLGKGFGDHGFKITFNPPLQSLSAPIVRIADNPESILKNNTNSDFFALDTSIAVQASDTKMLESNIETITGHSVLGWAWMPSTPDAHVMVEAVVDGQIIGSAIANQLRDDLAIAGKGKGDHGFDISFNAPLPANTVPVVRVAGEPNSILTVSEHVVVLTNENEASEHQFSLVESNVETITRQFILGWAWHPLKPRSHLRVEAVLDNQVIGSAVADIAREDLLLAGKGSGNHGFEITFDPPLTKDEVPTIRLADPPYMPLYGGTGRTFTLTDETGTATQSGSSDTVVLAEPRLEGYVDHLSHTKAIGWAWDAASPDARVEVEAIWEGKIIARGLCNKLREDLATFGKSDGTYGFVLEFDGIVPPGGTLPEIRVAKANYSLIVPESARIIVDVDQDIPSEASEAPNDQANYDLYEGHVDTVTRRAAHGWAWCPADPEREVIVQAVVADRVIGSARADVMRRDLLEYGKGTGQYGFSMQFDHFLAGNEVPTFRIERNPLVILKCGGSLAPLSEQDNARLARANLQGLVQDHLQFTQAGPEFEELDEGLLTKLLPCPREKPLVFAFYLPQFHPIPENDRFWGKGFTEWRQLARALPRFPGHYQPRIPRDLGFYELAGDDKVLREQARMAMNAGLGAFCYYYYWFNQKKVLERPLEIHLKSDLNMPFLIMWANENWTKTWDGMETNVLLRQDYKLEDEDALLADLARHFDDPRYIRIDGRPLFFIYNPRHIPNTKETVTRWREKLRKNQGCTPLMFMAQAFDTLDPTPFGLDGAIEFPPHKLAAPHPGRDVVDAYSPNFTGRVISYDDFVATSLLEDAPQYPVIKTAVPSWDNDARRPNRGLTLEGVSPKKYEKWISNLVQRAIENPVYGAPIVAINAWNEWAEAAYLEPDVHFGAAFLNATARGIVDGINCYAPRPLSRMPVTAVLPCFNHARFLPERIDSILKQTVPPAEIIFLDDCSTDNSVAVAEEILSKSNIPFQIIKNKKNSGCVFRQWIKGLHAANSNLIWIAETDDSADSRFLQNLLPAFEREDVMGAFGHIRCMDPEGKLLHDLDNYFDGMQHVSWAFSRIIPAATLFEHDFSVRNIVPNASGFVFRKPVLQPEEIERLEQYRFAGDWYFYALLLRGGSLAYRSSAKSYFRVNPKSASRSSFFGEKHLMEHQMILEDIAGEYGLSDDTLVAHCKKLAVYFKNQTLEDITGRFRAAIDARPKSKKRLRICIAAHSFSVGGGEVLPLELANKLKNRGHHISYLVMEPMEDDGKPTIRPRLRSDIPVFLLGRHQVRYLSLYRVSPYRSVQLPQCGS